MANILPPPPALPSGSVQYIHSSEKVQYVQSRGKRGKEHKNSLQQQIEEMRRQKKRDGKNEGRIDFNNLSKQIDPSNYRNSLFHNTCTSILAKGYHQSFTELFELVQKQREDHRIAGPGAILLSPLIDDKPDKLDYLQVCLMSAEDASRRGDLEAVYLSQRDLALHFDQTGDHWLSDHFHNRCLETGRLIKGDGRRKEGEAHFHVGLAYENRGDLDKAVEHMEIFYELTSANNWHTENGENLYRIACEHLRRIYTTIAEKSEDTSLLIEYLQKAHTMSKKAKDTYQEGLASYRLGCAHEKNKDFDTALQCHKSFLERSRYHSDEVGVGNAYEALARCHEHKGDLESAVQCLELYVNVAEKSGATESLAKSCRAAGTIFNTLFTSAVKDQTERGLMKLVDWKGKKNITEESETTDDDEKNNDKEEEKDESVQDSDRPSEKEDIEETEDVVEQVEDNTGIEKEETIS
uniref:Tetratricopeptide repeat protein 29 n=1 Tax=Amphimedon queenslandica TaxID=400682 RepID=A0A1X7TNC5_AMPQE